VSRYVGRRFCLRPGGNYEADERPSQFPKYDGRTVRPGNTMTPRGNSRGFVRGRDYQ
jgi:hypothetical protein